jgi:outer membrane lipoprotein-sorting protein
VEEPVNTLNAQRQTPKAIRTLLGVLFVALSWVGAQSPAEITKQVQANLEKSPWEATVSGKAQMPDGSSQDIEFRLQVLPGKEQLARVEFKKPGSLEGNFVVISDKEVWNYLFLTNQLIIQPRAKANIQGLGVNLSSLGDFEQIGEQVSLKLLGEEKTPEGAAWKLSGVPKDKTQSYASMEIVVLKADPRPLSLVLKDSGGKTLAELSFKDFKRVSLSAKQLKKYPADAEVVRK